MILALNLPSEKPSTECPPRLKHRCNRSTVPGSCSPHAKPALAHCLCRQVKSRQWSTPLASSTGATEARFQDLGSQLAVRSCRSLWSSLTGFLASRKASTGPTVPVKSRQWSAPLASSTCATEARLHDVGSQLAVRSCRSMWSLAHWLTRLTQSQH